MSIAQTAALAQLKDAVDAAYASGATAEHIMGVVAESSGAQLDRSRTSINQFLALFGVCPRLNEHLELQVAASLYELYGCTAGAPTTLDAVVRNKTQLTRLVQRVCAAGIERTRTHQIRLVREAITVQLCGVYKPKLDKGLDLLVVAWDALEVLRFVFVQVKDWTYMRPSQLTKAVDKLRKAAALFYADLICHHFVPLVDAGVLGGVALELLVVAPGCRVAKALPIYDDELVPGGGGGGVRAPVTVAHGTAGMTYVYANDKQRDTFVRAIRRTQRSVDG